jgi:polysaccharide export outer membrane protein
MRAGFLTVLLLASGLPGAWADGGVGAAAGSAAMAAPAPQDYRLGAGDVIRITVFQNPDLTLETRVSESGLVSYPLLGSLHLGGQPLAQAEKAIADGLREGAFVKQPQVSIVLLQVRGNQANVLGQVNRPGRFPLEVADMRLTDLLANAGGIASTGADTVVLMGTRDGKPYRQTVDLPGIFTAGGRSQDLPVQNGDVVWVDRAPLVYIYGEVQRPGGMHMERDMTLRQALANGGGLTPRGTERGIRVYRRDASGQAQEIHLEMEAAMKDGDVVYVKESLF